MEDRQDVPIQKEEKQGEINGVHAAHFAGLLEESRSLGSLRRGDIIEGVIVSKKSGEILVDIGAKSDGAISAREIERMSAKEMAEIHVGDRVPVCVLATEDQEGNVVLSLRRAQLERDWQEAQKLYEANSVIERPVVGHNKGGLIVRIGRVRGFVPVSQLSGETRRSINADKASDDSPLASLVGKTLSLKILEVDRKRNRLILSEREALKEERKQRKEQLLAELKVGEIRRGVISSLCPFGAFVDLGGADGLIHISELSWKRVNDPSEVVKVGDEVDVQILKVDQGRNRIALSLKRLQAKPWSMVDKTYYIGQLVKGTITKLTGFGAFARLDDNIEGLIHISELSDERINHPREVVKEGDVCTLRVIRIDSARRRLGLSLRRAQENYEELDWEGDYDASPS